MARNYCPLIRRDDGGLCACLTDDCAWFDRGRGVCAMVAIALRDRGRRAMVAIAREIRPDRGRC
jgi:hypothetical protein